jgi:hypothetical protein
MKYTFRMSDAWGSDYDLTVTAPTYAQARSIANLCDDDAAVEYLISEEEDE